MHKKSLNFFWKNKFFAALLIVFVGSIAGLFCYLGVNQPAAFAKENGKIVKTQDGATLQINESFDKVMVCCQGGIDTFNQEANENNLNECCNYAFKETLLELSTNKDYQKELEDYHKPKNNPFGYMGEKEEKVHDVEHISESKTKKDSDKCFILAFNVDNSDLFLDAIKDYSCVAWSKKDINYQILSVNDDDISSENPKSNELTQGKATKNDQDPDQESNTEDQTKNEKLSFQPVKPEPKLKGDNSEETNSAKADTDPANTATSDKTSTYTEYDSIDNWTEPAVDTFNNDPMYKEQWGFNSSWQKSGLDFDVDADAAWRYMDVTGYGSDQKAIVAVVDTGLDVNHPDMKANVWRGGNLPSLIEMGGCECGYNAMEGWETTDVTDDVGHGTHCASSVAGVNNNSTGVCGINGSNCLIMPVKHLGNSGGSAIDSIRAYKYVIAAKDAGVDVSCISNSWGASLLSQFEMVTTFDALVTEAGMKGMPSIFAAGNDSTNTDLYPNHSRLSPFALTVGASQENGSQTCFSNFGRNTCDVFSPGAWILQAVPELKRDPVDMESYLPWLEGAQKPEDEIFYEDFNTKTDDGKALSKIKFSIANKDFADEAFEDADCVIENGSAKIKLDKNKFNSGDTAVIRMQIPKTQELLDRVKVDASNTYLNIEALKPLVSCRYSLSSDLEVDASKEWKMWFGSVRHNSNITSENKGKFSISTHFDREYQVANVDGTYNLGNVDTDGEYIVKPFYPFDIKPSLKTPSFRPANCGENVYSRRLDSFELIPWDNEPNWNLCLVINTKTLGDDPYISIDDLAFGKKPSGYEYSCGTSMACPITAGIASAVSSRIKADSPAEKAIKILACIKSSVVKNDSLTDACIYGGVVNYYNALQAADCIDCVDVPEGLKEQVQPVVTNSSCGYDPEEKEEYVMLDGNFFGEEKGSITLNDQITDIVTWSNDRIICKISGIDYSCKELVLKRADGNTLQQTIRLNEDEEYPSYCNKAYEKLPSSGIVYTDGLGDTYTVNDMNPVNSVSTEDNLYVLYFPSEQQWFEEERNLNYILEAYNYETETWKNIPLDNLHLGYIDQAVISYIDEDARISMAAGKDEIYFTYFKDPSFCDKSCWVGPDGDNCDVYGKTKVIPESATKNDAVWAPFLATYSENENDFIYDSSIKDFGNLGANLVNYNGELYIGGLDFYTEISSINQYAGNNVIKIFPDTGCAQDSPLSFGINLTGSRVSCADGRYWLSDARATSFSAIMEISGDKVDPVFREVYENNLYGPLRFDPNDIIDGGSHKYWPNPSENSDYTFYDPAMLKNCPEITDDGQNPASVSACAVDQGLLYVGSAQNNGKKNMNDTLLFRDDDSGVSWNRYEGISFSDNKVDGITCCTHDNKLYVVGNKAFEHKTLFKSLNLDDLGLSAAQDYVNAQTQKDLGLSDDAPSKDVIDSNVHGPFIDEYFVSVDSSKVNPALLSADSSEINNPDNANTSGPGSDETTFVQPVYEQNNGLNNNVSNVSDNNISSDSNNKASSALSQTSDILSIALIVLLVSAVLAGGILCVNKSVKSRKGLHGGGTFVCSNKKLIVISVAASAVFACILGLLLFNSLAHADESDDKQAEPLSNNAYVDFDEYGNSISVPYTICNKGGKVTQYWIEDVQVDSSQLENVNIYLFNLKVNSPYGELWSNAKALCDVQERCYAYAWDNKDCQISLELDNVAKKDLEFLNDKSIFKIKLGYRYFDSVENATFDDYSWDQLRVVADDLSLNDTKSMFYKQFSSFAENGDAKHFFMEDPNLKFLSEKDDVYVRIVGINQDVATGSDKKAGLTFMPYNAINTPCLYGHSPLVSITHHNSLEKSEEWNTSVAREVMNKGGELYNKYPESLTSNLCRVDKKYATRIDEADMNEWRSNNDLYWTEFEDKPELPETQINKTSDDFFLASASELGIKYHEWGVYVNDNEGEAYKYVGNNAYFQRFKYWHEYGDLEQVFFLGAPSYFYKELILDNDPNHVYDEEKIKAYDPNVNCDYNCAAASITLFCRHNAKSMLINSWLRSVDTSTSNCGFILSPAGEAYSRQINDYSLAKIAPMFCM